MVERDPWMAETPKMRIAMGIDRSDGPEGIQELVDLGADEFFAGYVPVAWYNRFGWEVSINRRENGPVYQFTQFHQIAAAVRAVHAAGARIHLTINAHDYDQERAEITRETLEDLETLEPDSYIVADPAMMAAMRSWGIRRPLHLSTGAGCFNPETVRWYHDFVEFERVVIPRKMTLREMPEFIRALDDLALDFEVMIIGPRCFYNDEYCFTLHTGNLPNFCNHLGNNPHVLKRFPPTWKQDIAALCEAGEDPLRPGSALDRFVRQVLWDGRAAGPAPSPPPAGAGIHAQLAARFFMHCGLCAIASLRKAGVRVLKVPVRGSSWAKKKYLSLVRAVADHPNPTPEVCAELLGSPGFCAMTDSCYYHLPQPPQPARTENPMPG